VEAARNLGIQIFVYDPAPEPDDFDLSGVNRILDEDEFYRLDVDAFHLALHPHHRQRPLHLLLERTSQGDLFALLVEKPMAPPEAPEECGRLIEEADKAQALLLFDFPELFDPMTHRVAEFLQGLREPFIRRMELYRSKDREDPMRPRNYKVMVPIEYQETVHDLAYILTVLGCVREGLEDAFDDGATVNGKAQPYNPPNPEDYTGPVDGLFDGSMEIAGADVHLYTNFKAGAAFQKRKVIEGESREGTFRIEAEHLEGAKRLVINGEDQGFARDASSYRHVLQQLGRWRQELSFEKLQRGLLPNPRLTRATYMLSSMLWDACRSAAPVRVDSYAALLAYQPSYPSRGAAFSCELDSDGD
jgi:predicted dehydrogenase